MVLVLVLVLVAGPWHRPDGAAAQSVPAVAGPVRAALLELEDVGDLTVDPGTGNVFVAGDAAVRVFGATGDRIGSISIGAGATALDIAGDDLYALSLTPAVLHRIPLGTLTVAETWPIALNLGDALAVAGGTAWLAGQSGTGSDRALFGLDLETGTLSVRSGPYLDPGLLALPEDRVLVYERGLMGRAVVVDTAAGTTTEEVEVGVVRDAALSADGRRILLHETGNDPTRELRAADLTPAGRQLPVQRPTRAVASGGGLWAGTADLPRTLWVADQASPTAVATFRPTGYPLLGGVAVAPDGRFAYALTDWTGNRLEVFDLAPSITTVSPATVVEGARHEVVVEGQGLGRVVEATVGGIEARVVVDDPSRVRVSIPRDVPHGTTQLALRTPIGLATTTVSVLPAPGATLEGTVTGATWGTEIDLSLHASALPLPQVATAAPDGSYRFDGLPFGADYRLEVRVAGAPHAVRTIRGLLLRPEEVRRLDVDLDEVTTGSPALVSWDLEGAPRDLVTHGPTGRTFVSAGDEVVVFDAAGDLIHHVADQWGAGQLDLVDDELYVALNGAGAVSRIDVTTLEVTTTVSAERPVNGAIAYAGGRIWLGPGLTSLDPGSGDIESHPLPYDFVDTDLAPVDDDEVLLTGATWLRGHRLLRLDVSGDTPTVAAEASLGGDEGTGPVHADADLDLAWTENGVELRLDTLAPTGERYGRVWASSDALGGTILVGTKVHLLGGASPIAELQWGTGGLHAAFAPGGERVAAARWTSDDATFALVDLSPSIGSLTPAAVIAGERSTVTLHGTGLHEATSVDVGDATVPAVPSPDALGTELSFDVPEGTEAGRRAVTVTTTLGQSTADLTVVENRGGAIAGRVTRTDGRSVGGVDVIVSGGELDAARTTTSGPDGFFVLEGLPTTTDLRLVVRDPAGAHIEQVVTGISTRANAITPVHVVASTTAPLTSGPVRREHPLQAPSAAVVPHPTDGRVLVTAGDELITFDAEGRLLARTLGLDGAADVAVVAHDAFVTFADRGLARVDLDTYEVVERRQDGPTDDALTAVGGRLWYSINGKLTTLDPTTGEVVITEADAWARRQAVDGSSDLLVRWATYSGSPISVLDVSGPSPVVVSNGWASQSSAEDLDASATTGTMWRATGDSYALADLTAREPTFPRAYDNVDHTDGGGGLLAVGTTLFRPDDATPIASIGLDPNPQALVLSPAGDRVYAGTRTGTFAVWSLAPTVAEVVPTVVAPGVAAEVVLTGTGMATLERAEVGGTQVPFEVLSTTQVRLDLPAEVTDVASPGTLEVSLFSALGDATGVAAVDVATTPPSAPTDLAVEAGPGRLAVEWAPPASQGSAPIQGYELAVNGDGDGEAVQLPATATRATVLGNGSGQPVVVGVRARTAVGASPWIWSVPVAPLARTALFDDVGPDHALYREILVATEDGVTLGNGDGTFGPAAPIARQAAVTFLWRAAGSPSGPFPDPGFTDVATTDPFATPIAWAAAEGITTGNPDGTFAPGATVTRGAMVAFLWRAAGSPPGPFPDPGFTDVATTHPFATPIAWAAAEGITTGNPDRTFAPGATVTRQAAVAFLVRPTWLVLGDTRVVLR